MWQECRELEQHFETDFTSVLMDKDAPHPHPREIKKVVQTKDQEDMMMCSHEGRIDKTVVVQVEKAIGWPRLWDPALDHGPKSF